VAATATALVLHPDDDVAVLLEPVTAGSTIIADGPGGRFTLQGMDELPLGHKIALRDLPADHRVRKHGEVIGRLTQPVAAGAHVHVHNLQSLRGGA
jgi:altronate hydrolase/altronate dehydratase small subunit